MGVVTLFLNISEMRGGGSVISILGDVFPFNFTGWWRCMGSVSVFSILGYIFPSFKLQDEKEYFEVKTSTFWSFQYSGQYFLFRSGKWS